MLSTGIRLHRECRVTVLYAPMARLGDLLGARQVPVIAVFSASDPNNPTGVFRGAYTQQQVLDALEKAGPSREPLLTRR